jgi:glycosyltransferase involved in cell wall biosynthesis
VRIALVTEIPAPFRIPLWNALAARPDVDLSVLLLREHDPRRSYELHRDEWRFDAELLPGRDLLLGRRWLVLSRGTARRLARTSPELVILGGWNQPAFLRAAAYARRRAIPYLAWVESTSRDERPRRVGFGAVKRWLLRGASGVIVPGTAAADYVASLGVEARRVTRAPNAFDADRFARALDEATSRRAELRRELGFEGCVFVSVARLSPEKGAAELVRAIAGVPAQLVVVGNGPELEALERRAPANVRFVGHVPRAELARWYAAADAFALASRSETWGMAVAEAATAGLPIVVTEAVGAGWDLLEPGVSGFRVPVGDENALREALTAVATDEPFRLRAGARSRELVAGATPEAWGSAVADLARRVLA